MLPFACVVEEKLSDHYFVVCVLCSENSMSSNILRTTEIVDNTIFDKLIRQCDWEAVGDLSCPTAALDMFLDNFHNCYRYSKRSVRVKKRKTNLPWINNNIMAEIKIKEVLWRRCRRHPEDMVIKRDFRLQRNKVTALIRLSKNRYFQGLFRDARNVVKKTWRVINELRGQKVVGNLDDVLRSHFRTTDGLADKFGETFGGVVGTATPVGFRARNCFSICNSALLPEMTEDDLFSIVRNLPNTRSPDCDGIRVSDFKRNFEVICNSVLHILNCVFTL